MLPLHTPQYVSLTVRAILIWPLLTCAACGADLDRQAGTLVVTVRSVDPAATRVVLTVSNDRATFQLERPAAEPLELRVDSVVAGSTMIDVSTFQGGDIRQQRDRIVTIAADMVNSVEVDLAPRSQAQTIEVSLVGAPSGGQITFTAATPLDLTDLVSAFQQLHSGATIGLVELLSVEIERSATGGSDDDDDDGSALDEILSGLVTVRLRPQGGADVAVASGAVNGNRSALVVSPGPLSGPLQSRPYSTGRPSPPRSAAPRRRSRRP